MLLAFRAFAFACLPALAPLFLHAADSPSIAIDEAVAVHREEPRFPATMRAIGVKEGRVRLMVSVDEHGRATDLFVAEASRRAFAQSALKAVENWRFAPAVYNNAAFPSALQLEFRFQLGRELQWQTFTAPVETNIAQSGHAEQPVTAYPLQELDTIPLPLKIVEPGPHADAQATIEFYIDELGNVRAARLISGDDLDFGRATLEAVSEWRFEPPSARGIKTNALVRQTFRIENGRLLTSKAF